MLNQTAQMAIRQRRALRQYFAATRNLENLDLELQVEAIKFHYLVPGGDEILDEFLLRTIKGIYLGNGTQFRV